MNQMSYAVASDSVGRSVEAKPSFMTLSGTIKADRLVLAYLDARYDGYITCCERER